MRERTHDRSPQGPVSGRPDSRAALAGRPGHGWPGAREDEAARPDPTDPPFDTWRGGAGGLGAREGYGSYGTGADTADDPAQRVAAANLAGIGPKGYRRADSRIRDDVAEEMTAHPDLDASDLEIDVADGVVRLRGRVASRRQKWLAEDCCARVVGVTDVQDEMRVVRQR